MVQHSSGSINLLDVQVFFTSNALDTLPHEVVLEKISFYILHGYTGKIPKPMANGQIDDKTFVQGI